MNLVHIDLYESMMTPEHKLWSTFVNQLEKELEKSKCAHDYQYCRQVLQGNKYRGIGIERSITFFKYRNADCDCEVLLLKPESIAH